MVEAERLHDLETAEEPGVEAVAYTTSSGSVVVSNCCGRATFPLARTILEQELREYERRGRYLFREEILGYLSQGWSAGRATSPPRRGPPRRRWRSAWNPGASWVQAQIRFPKALVAAYRGDVDAARSDAEEGLHGCLQYEDLLNVNCHRSVLGFLELSLGNPAGAHEWLAPVVGFLEQMATPEGLRHPPCMADEIEALTLLGDTDAAERLLQTPLETQGRSLDRPWAIATAARCRALLLAVRKDLDAARDVLELALKEHDRVGQPLERGRTLLLRVRWNGGRSGGATPGRRWRRRWTSSRGSAPGSRPTQQRGRSSAWGALRGDAGELTGSERRVAELVAGGRTNREVAEALFLSVKHSGGPSLGGVPEARRPVARRARASMG